jgi:stage IV sporulation protein FB
LTKKNKKFIIHPLTAVFMLLALRGAPSLFGMILLCSSIHELGHYFTARLLGLKLAALTVYPFGADMVLTPPLRSYGTDIAVHLSGPVLNVMLGGVGHITGAGELFCACNLTLGILNLLPLLGLDGGNALYSLICTVTDPKRAYGILKAVTVLLSVAVWVASVYLMLVLGSDPSMFFIASAVFFTTVTRK